MDLRCLLRAEDIDTENIYVSKDLFLRGIPLWSFISSIVDVKMSENCKLLQDRLSSVENKVSKIETDLSSLTTKCDVLQQELDLIKKIIHIDKNNLSSVTFFPT